MSNQATKSGWKKVKVGDVLRKIGTHDKLKRSDYDSNGHIPVIDQGEKFISWFSNVEDLIYSTYPVIVFWDHTRILKYIDFPFICWADWTQLLLPNDSVSIRFFYYSLKDLNLRNYWYERHFKYLKEEVIIVPESLLTQQKIASILSRYDDLIENNTRRIRILEQAASEIYREWYVRYRYPWHESVPLVASGTDLGMIPEGWEVKMIGDVLAPVKRKSKLKVTEYQESWKFPIIDQWSDFIAGYTDDSDTVYEEDLIVFWDHTRCLKYCNFAFACGADGTQLLKAKDEGRMPLLLLFFTLKNAKLQNDHYARHFKFLKALEVLLPSKDVSVKYDFVVRDLFEEIKVLRNMNIKLWKSRDLLLPRLIRGELDVESLDIPV